MTNLKKTFGANVKEVRSRKGISQGELAEASGIDQARLSRMENGQIDIGILTLEKIANALDVSPAELLINNFSNESSLNEKLLQINSLNEYDQKLVEAILETYLEKGRLEKMQDIKMKNRLEELDQLRSSK